MPATIELTLAHSPDPDDAFMWWPLTGTFDPARAAELQGAAYGVEPVPEAATLTPPELDTGRFRFRALPADIEALNRRAATAGDLAVTALSVRTWADVRHRYAVTRCGASFGDGYGPKLIARASNGRITRPADAAGAGVRTAVPGRRTTAFLMLGLALGKDAMAAGTFVEMPFDQIIPAVARGEVDAGLIIHEGQITYPEAGLRLLLDVGRWWKDRTGLKLPLGVNAVRRDLDSLHGAGTVRELGGLLRRSVAHAMDHWDRSVRTTVPFAAANARRAGAGAPTLEQVDRYCRMYVTAETRDMGETGREAISQLLREGASAGLVPPVDAVDLV